ncbi:DUF1810 domain-containing protein [Larkinella punicea]|uniref:DUF1810 domain-containing protein n=1 Tax=Larkinella punicea TaxID=2315727 RepID=A0A368JIJ1_9BACT|nr:DUF1810 domain-containing protein [Larkinella punicea]RCR67478.1 DUF1810 domain-containing protein [Larkinella punicea]
MKADDNLKRFLDAQQPVYFQALSEIKNGRKQSHWMWFIFPQLAGLGFSEMARFYAIHNLEEARAYLEHPVLGDRLLEISNALLGVVGKTANQILGSPDDLKLRSSMTLFSLPKNTNPVFQAVLDKYFDGLMDLRTIELVRASEG